MTRFILSLALLLGGWIFYSPPVHAACEVQTATVTYANGAFIGGDLCDAYGNKKMAIGGVGTSGLGVANAAAPTFAEAASGYFSWDLAGNLRMTLGTLLSGEDQTNNLLMTSGGAVRGTVGNVATLTTDATSTAVQLPTGTKRIRGTLDAAGAQTMTVNLYGGDTSGVTASTGDLLCTLTFTVSTHDQATCPVMTSNYLWYIAVSSSTTGSPTGVITATY